MTSTSFFNSLEQHFTQDLPFVVYRKNNETIVKGLLQKDRGVNYVSDFKESGFVFAPFDTSNDTVIIPLDGSEYMEADYHPNRSSNEDLSFQCESFYDNQKQNHMQLVHKGVEAIKEGQFKKVVLSRVDVQDLSDSKPIKLFKSLLINYPQAFVYCWYHPKVGLWLGATPETLIKVANNQFETMSLAGTQQSSVREANWTDKEKNEQQIVTDYVVSQLKDLSKTIHVSKPRTVQAGNLVHLQSTVSGTLYSKDLKPIIKALHPTPAVCGFPKEMAKQFILQEEGYDRSFYTGFLGELNFKEQISRNRNRQNVENNVYAVVKNVSNLYVNLRCMQLQQDKALIYVGGGITFDSNPEEEWQETVSKSMTVKKALL
ncbi:chorismate-binding protein [Hanstruepera flava]|uniref:chorismate-binding protein n=1 Tax=Hanstruepera flava TaxID=2930218 RepID=UPI002028E43F|nr:chorismate-binding protein [Hanstruepera flava]